MAIFTPRGMSSQFGRNQENDTAHDQDCADDGNDRKESAVVLLQFEVIDDLLPLFAVINPASCIL